MPRRAPAASATAGDERRRRAVCDGAEAEVGDGGEAVGGLGAQVGGDDRVGDDERAERRVAGAKPPPMPAETTRPYGRRAERGGGQRGGRRPRRRRGADPGRERLGAVRPVHAARGRGSARRRPASRLGATAVTLQTRTAVATSTRGVRPRDQVF